MESLTSCEVCLEEYSGVRRPMVVCLNGHTFCSPCSDQLTICAQCRQRCLPQKIVNIALLRIVEQNNQASSHRDSHQASSHDSLPQRKQAEESEVYPSHHRPIYPGGSQDFDESGDLDSVLRDETLARWREEESETSDEDEQLEELRGAAGLFPGAARLFPGATRFLQGATGFLFQEHLMTLQSQHEEEEDEDENEMLRQALAASQEEILATSVAEQEERDEEALMCALALSIDEQ